MGTTEEKPRPKAVAKAPASKLNKDGVEAGKILTDAEYWALINKKK